MTVNKLSTINTVQQITKPTNYGTKYATIYMYRTCDACKQKSYKFYNYISLLQSLFLL